MKTCKTDRPHQQHKLYEQERRTQIVSLISSLRECLPRDFKPARNNQREILAALLTYVRHLKEKEAAGHSLADEDLRNDLEKQKTYIAELEKRCDCYAKMLDAAGAESKRCRASSSDEQSNSEPKTSLLNSQKLPLSGPVSVIAASAPLVFFVSDLASRDSKKTYVDASTALDDDLPMSAASSISSTRPIVQDSSTMTDEKAMVDGWMQTELVEVATRVASIEVQVGTSDYVDRGSSPIPAKHRLTSETALDGFSSEATRNKRRRSDELTPTIAEIVDFVAANGSGESSSTSNVDLPASSNRRPPDREQLPRVNSDSSFDGQPMQSQDSQRNVVHGDAVSGTGARTAISLPDGSAQSNSSVDNTSSSVWNNMTASADRLGVANQNLLQSRSSQQEQPSQRQRHQQQPFTPSGEVRHQLPGSRTYHRTSTETNERSYVGSDGNRIVENCNKTSSRRGANFSVEFLHGGGNSIQVQQRQSHQVGPGVSASRLESHDQAPYGFMNCGYYDQHQTTYASSSSQFTPDHFFASDPSSYNWWTTQTPATGFSSVPSGARQTANVANPSVNANKSTSNSNDKPASSGNQPSARRSFEDQGINLSNPGFHNPSLLHASGGYIATPSTNVDAVWTQNAASSRFGYSTPTFVTESSNLNYLRHNPTSSRTCTASTSTTTTSTNVAASLSSNYSYPSHYWAPSEWSSSTFSANPFSSSNLNSADASTQQHPNNGKTQNFQIASMFPEAESSTSSWRCGDGYGHQNLHGRNETTFETSRMAAVSTSYLLPPPSYRQATSDSLSDGTPRFS